jgi:hypothetical protein
MNRDARVLGLWIDVNPQHFICGTSLHCQTQEGESKEEGEEGDEIGVRECINTKCRISVRHYRK